MYRKGDKIIMGYIGLLADGTRFDVGQSEFKLGEGKVNIFSIYRIYLITLLQISDLFNILISHSQKYAS